MMARLTSDASLTGVSLPDGSAQHSPSQLSPKPWTTQTTDHLGTIHLMPNIDTMLDLLIGLAGEIGDIAGRFVALCAFRIKQSDWTRGGLRCLPAPFRFDDHHMIPGPLVPRRPGERPDGMLRAR